MKKEEALYLFWVLVHAGLGFVLYFVPFLAKVYGYGIYLFGLYYVINSQNKNQEALILVAYLVGGEVFLRMTGGNPSYEITKYGVIFFLFLGLAFGGGGKTTFVYWLFLLLLIPGIILGALELNINIKNSIAFNISGPVSLGIASVYTYRKKITLAHINSILLILGLPIVSTVCYLFLYTPNVREVITGTQSNFQTSGGFGPNQVATVLGLGMFIFLSRIMLESKSKIMLIINLILFFNCTYRGMITFSRGGMITGFLMVISLLYFLFIKSNFQGKVKLNFIFMALTGVLLMIWMYTSFQTNGLINNRYANKDALGRVKESQFTGREEIASEEILIFLDNPIIGAGVGRSAEIRASKMGYFSASHDEITRMLAEHGILGLLGLLLLIFTPLILLFKHSFNIYLLPFVLFWFLTINHAAMRTAMPSFIYALCLLDVQLFPNRKQVEM